MAEIPYERIELEGHCYLYVWEDVTEADTCEPVYHPGAADKTIQVVGTFGGATVGVKGSVQPKPASAFFSLSGPDGDAIALTAAGGSAILEAVNGVQPVATEGSSQEITIYLFCRSTNR